MSSNKMTVEQARAKLGDLVIAAMRGEVTTITRYGKPAARIVPIEEPAMTEHFTAWLTTDPTCMEQDQTRADVIVLTDELIGENPDDDSAWASTTDQRFSALTTVDAVEGDHVDALREAKELLKNAGWEIQSKWEDTSSGYFATVARA